eukprot:11916880-Heterocapsa_arctica.AAC.1
MAFGGGVNGDEEDEVREQCLAADGAKHHGRHDERHDGVDDVRHDERHDEPPLPGAGPLLAPEQLPWPVERGKRRRVLGRIMKG